MNGERREYGNILNGKFLLRNADACCLFHFQNRMCDWCVCVRVRVALVFRDMVKWSRSTASRNSARTEKKKQTKLDRKFVAFAYFISVSAARDSVCPCVHVHISASYRPMQSWHSRDKRRSHQQAKKKRTNKYTENRLIRFMCDSFPGSFSARAHKTHDQCRQAAACFMYVDFVMSSRRLNPVPSATPCLVDDSRIGRNALTYDVGHLRFQRIARMGTGAMSQQKCI